MELTVRKVAVVGAGVMGADVALDLASHGYDVILKDVSNEILGRAAERMRKNIEVYRLISENLRGIPDEQIFEHIKMSSTYAGFHSVDFVIENVTEEWSVKRTVYGELGEVCRDTVYYGVNTSCMSITKIASLVSAPDRVVGVHFLNPAPIKDLVEVIRGFHTSDGALHMVQDFLKSLHKSSVIVADLPGFVTNRVLMLAINECVWVVQDDVAQPKDVDKLFRVGFGHEMGPLATADLIGLDTVLRSLEALYQQFKDTKFRPAPLLAKMVDAGLLGRKTGKGFFNYQFEL